MEYRNFIAAFLLISFNTFAQTPAYVFSGGIGQGYNSATDSSDMNTLSNGGIGVGYDNSEILTEDQFMNIGGLDDGYNMFTSLSSSQYLSNGGIGDGYTHIAQTEQNHFLSNGGFVDGYDMKESKEKFVWTGALGTGWNVDGNWNHNEYPDIDRPVVIPAGASNYPFINVGIFAIGANPNNGAFACESLCILNGAMLTTRINNKVENYGLIEIAGTMRVLRPTSDAFLNHDTGIVYIYENGKLEIKPQ